MRDSYNQRGQPRCPWGAQGTLACSRLWLNELCSWVPPPLQVYRDMVRAVLLSVHRTCAATMCRLVVARHGMTTCQPWHVAP